MDLPLPDGWEVDGRANGMLALTDGINLWPNMTMHEVYNRIASHWKMNGAKLENDDEQYRKAIEAARGPAVAQSARGDAGRAPQASRPFPAVGTGAPRAQQGTGLTIVSTSPIPSVSAHSAVMIAHHAQQVAFQNVIFGIVPASLEPLPREAPKLGEIIGHRAWTVQGRNLLLSLSAGSAWFPGQPMVDNVGHGQEIEDHNDAGIWAFKDPYRLAREFWATADRVFGTVWLWGTVIEHEYGYRAQYAAVRSLDHASPGLDLDILRAAYRLKT